MATKIGIFCSLIKFTIIITAVVMSLSGFKWMTNSTASEKNCPLLTLLSWQLEFGGIGVKVLEEHVTLIDWCCNTWYTKKTGRVTVTYISLTYQRQQTAAGWMHIVHKYSSGPSSCLWWGWQLGRTSKTHTIHRCRPLSAVSKLATPTEPSAPRASWSTFCNKQCAALIKMVCECTFYSS